MSLGSPFADRIRTNYVPHSDEEASIRAIIEQQYTTIRKLESDAADIDKKVAQLEAEKREIQILSDVFTSLVPDSRERSIDKAIAELEAKKRETMQTRDSYRTFADAHRVWSQVPESGPSGREPPPTPSLRSPTYVASYRLRTIALSTPTLWSTFSMADLPLPNDASQRTIEAGERRMGFATDMLSAFIHRAGASPMTIEFGAKDPTFTFGTQAYTRMLQPLIRLVRQVQWKTVEMFLHLRNTESPLLQLLEITRNSDRTLQSARFLIVIDVPPIAQEIVEHLDLQNAMELTYLGLGMPAQAILDARINWTTLTEIMLHGANQLHPVLSVLSKCPNLARCTIELDSRSSPVSTLPPDIPQLITLPHLQSLTLLGFQPTAHFPQALSLPSLRLLDISDKVETFKDYRCFPPLDVALPEWIRLHGAQLTHLKFSYARITLPTLLSCLEGTPNLLSLELQPPLLVPFGHFTILIGDGRLINFPLPALLAMTPQFDETGEHLTKPCSCPKLERIIIYGPQSETGDEYWVDFVSSRRRESHTGVGYIKSVDVRYHTLDHDGVGWVDWTRAKVYNSLLARGVSLDGIDFHVRVAG